ncbi:hypothetical protein J2X11_000906 [Aeromicrobium panaciterrae]|uniref:Sortase n=1 Tax=Aeromicrobium panaciterrae TaxID=363861 RepID=A0ABU1ULJ9_9ACTN|nr:hypothetical protein [Aeromicrobium panaciterrae]MDR7086067.1 hypothetical protein [Aeromicrobium panaciterrae]
MRRMIVLVVGLIALVVTVVAVQLPTDSAKSVEAPVVVPPREAPEPRFSRTTYGLTNLDGSTAMLDECKGPVAVWLGEGRPTLVAEHDYCGGMFWMSKLKEGDAVELDGKGVDDGIFVVTSLTYETRNEVTVGDLPEADLVLQTCVTKTRLVLVGLERFEA